MNKNAFILGCLFLIYSCTTEPEKQKAPGKPMIDINDVKSRLCYSEEECPDSVHAVQLKNSNLYILQDFGAVLNMIRLIRLEQNSFVVLDSIRTYQQIDLFKQQKINYNYKNDWFVYSDISSGTGDLSNTLSLVRVENNHFSTLFSFSKSASFVDVEADSKNLPYSQVENREIEMSKKRIRLKTDFKSGISNSNQPTKKITDTVTFEFSNSDNCFILKKPPHSVLKDHFWPDKGEYIFRY